MNTEYAVESVQIKITRSSADADKPAPARRVYRSVKVTKHSTNPVSYCAIVSLSLRRAIFTIFDFTMLWSWNRVSDPSRSLEMSPCDRAYMTSYWRSIVTMVLSRVVSEIFNVEKCRDREIGVRGHSSSLKMVPFGRPCMVSY